MAVIERKFKNVEFLRFILVWAVVGFHMVDKDNFNPFGFEWLKSFMSNGYHAVGMFFIIAGFFLFLKPNISCSIIGFYKNKWFRMAPLIIVTTIVYYVLHKLGLFHHWDWSSNILNVIFVKDWGSLERFGQSLPQTWFISELILISSLYMALYKTFEKKYFQLIVAFCMYVGLRIWVLSSVLPKYGSVPGHDGTGIALLCIGIGYFISEFYKCQHTLTISCEKTWKILCTIAECFLCFFIFRILFAVGHSKLNLNYLTILLLFVCLFWLFINGRGYLSQLLEKDWCVFLGRYSFAIFIVHILVIESASEIVFPIFKDWVIAHNELALSGIVLAIMFLAVLGYHFVEVPVIRWSKRIKK